MKSEKQLTVARTKVPGKSLFDLNDPMFSDSQSNKSESLIDSNKLICIQNKKGKQYCIEEKCKHYAIVCGDEDCKCNLNHQECANFYKINKLNHQILKNAKSTDIGKEIKKSIMTIQDSFSDLEDRLLKEIEYFGLNEQEKYLIKNLSADYRNLLKCQEKFKPSLTSQIVKECLTNLNLAQNDRLELFYEQLCQEIERQKGWVCTSMDGMVEIIEAQFRGNKEKNYWKDSTIVRTEDEMSRMNNFMKEEMKKIKKFELIFRGSVDGMSMEQFYSKCGNKPNLLFLVENEFGKKYGGFTPCQISTDRQKMYETDNQLRSFVFSLDADKKAFPINSQHAVRNGSKGKYCQILIEFGCPSNLIIGANSLQKKQNNWIKFSSLDGWGTYRLAQNPPSDNQCCGARQPMYKLREVEVYQIVKNRRLGNFQGEKDGKKVWVNQESSF